MEHSNNSIESQPIAKVQQCTPRQPSKREIFRILPNPWHSSYKAEVQILRDTYNWDVQEEDPKKYPWAKPRPGETAHPYGHLFQPIQPSHSASKFIEYIFRSGPRGRDVRGRLDALGQPVFDEETRLYRFPRSKEWTISTEGAVIAVAKEWGSFRPPTLEPSKFFPYKFPNDVAEDEELACTEEEMNRALEHIQWDPPTPSNSPPPFFDKSSRSKISDADDRQRGQKGVCTAQAEVKTLNSPSLPDQDEAWNKKVVSKLLNILKERANQAVDFDERVIAPLLIRLGGWNGDPRVPATTIQKATKEAEQAYGSCLLARMANKKRLLDILSSSRFIQLSVGKRKVLEDMATIAGGAIIHAMETNDDKLFSTAHYYLGLEAAAKTLWNQANSCFNIASQSNYGQIESQLSAEILGQWVKEYVKSTTLY